MKRCVVTGAGGLIGSHVLRLLTPEWEVHAVSRHRPADLDDLSVVWHHLDVARELDPGSLPERADAIVYLAQSEHFREFPERARDIFEVNTSGMLRFLDYARRCGAKTVVYGSSGGVYGSGDASMNEDLVIPAEGGLGFYLGTKLCSEIIAESYSPLMNVIVLRFFFVYGQGQRRTMLIPRLIDNVRGGNPVTLQGPDGIRINPTHASDAAGAIVRALGMEGSHKINVAGPEVLSLRQICEVIGKAVGREPVYAVDASATPRHIVGDIARMSALLGAPGVRFEDGLRSML